MSEATVVRELNRSVTGARQCLVQRGDDYFVVSSVTAFDTGQFETLTFPSDAEGNVTDWGEVAGGMGRTRDEAIAELAEGGHEPNANMEQWVDELGGPLPAIASTLVGMRDSILGTLPYDSSDEV